MDRVSEAIDLIKDKLTAEQLKLVDIIMDLAEEFNYMDYNDWEDYREDGLEEYMYELFGLKYTPKGEWTTKATDCPKCGKTLIRLEPYKKGVCKFWCDDCNIDIVYEIGE